MLRSIALPILLASLAATSAQATTVVTTHPVTTTSNGAATSTVAISSNAQPDIIGQVFVPTQSYLTSLGFRFGSTTNTKTGNVTLSIYAGAIKPGSTLPASAVFSQQFALSNLIFRGVGSFVDFSTGTLAVAKNTAYTVVLSSSSNVALAYGTGDGYTSGYLLQTKLNNATCRNTPNACDASFRFTTASPAPEPAQWGLLLSGFAVAGGAMRYRRRRALVSFG